PGGYLVFNDFAHIDPYLGAYGVHRAVVAFAIAHNWPFRWWAYEGNGLYDVALERPLPARPAAPPAWAATRPRRPPPFWDWFVVAGRRGVAFAAVEPGRHVSGRCTAEALRGAPPARASQGGNARCRSELACGLSSSRRWSPLCCRRWRRPRA